MSCPPMALTDIDSRRSASEPHQSSFAARPDLRLQPAGQSAIIPAADTDTGRLIRQSARRAGRSVRVMFYRTRLNNFSRRQSSGLGRARLSGDLWPRRPESNPKSARTRPAGVSVIHGPFAAIRGGQTAANNLRRRVWRHRMPRGGGRRPGRSGRPPPAAARGDSPPAPPMRMPELWSLR